MDTTPLFRRLTDAFQYHGFENLMVVLALVIGFFHGWLKLRFRSPITTFAFDLPLLLAIGSVLARTRNLQEFFPAGRSARPILVFFGVALGWLFLGQALPWGAPFLAGLAALRAWCFSLLMLGLGYKVIESRSQMVSYLFIIIVLAAITGFYSTRQTEEEVLALRALDPYYERMTRGQAFVDDEGRWVLRRFSTFISSGAFGGAMAICLSFAGALLTDPRIRRVEKAVITVLSLFAGWGLFLSGSRSSVVALLVGLGIVVAYRRLAPGLILLIVICGVGLYLGGRTTSGSILDRFSTLSGANLLGRLIIVIVPGWSHLLESGFIGGGLGKAMAGMPQFLLQYVGYFEVWGVDGDLGKAMAEFGVVGLSVLCWILWAGLQDGFSVMRRQRHTDVGTMGLAALVICVNAVIGFPTGSPFLGIPLGVLTWFFVGSALKLDHLTRPTAILGSASNPSATRRASSSPPPAAPRPAPSPSPSPSSSPTPTAPASSAPPATARPFMFATPPPRPAADRIRPRPGKPSSGPGAPTSLPPAPPAAPPPPAPVPAPAPPRPRKKPFLY